MRRPVSVSMSPLRGSQGLGRLGQDPSDTISGTEDRDNDPLSGSWVDGEVAMTGGRSRSSSIAYNAGL